MIRLSANLATKLKTASCLLCLAMFSFATNAQPGERTSVTEQEAQIWKEHGFTATDAGEWKHTGFSPAEARRWVEAGIPFPLWADQWRGEGFGPEQAKEWVGKVNVYTAGDFRKSGFGTREALAWIDNGVRSALRAKEFRDRGFSPQQAGLWWKRGFFPDEAKTWRDADFTVGETLEWKYGNKRTYYMRGGVKGYSQEVYPVEWARQWKASGFTSAEAKQCRLFAMPFDEALRWKQAGFVLHEAFQWKDSGFFPDEARKKADEGMTPVEAEQARDAETESLGDEILSFHTDILLHPDSTLTVTENLEVQVRPGHEMHERFERVFAGRVTLWHRDDSQTTTAPSYKLIQVLKEGRPADYSVKKDSWGDQTLRIKAGAPADRGVHHFTIKYSTDCRAVELYDHDQLFFDITGQHLKMPVKAASATVYLPKGAHLISADGYAGPRERKYFVVDVMETEAGDQANYSVSRPLKKEMVFQISVALTKGFAQPGLMRTLGHVDRQAGRLLSAVAVFVFGLVLVALYFIFIWRKVGKDPAKGTMAPQVEPPAGISPAMMGYIANRGRMTAGVVTAALVNLAQQRVVSISQDSGIYRLSLAEGPPAPCPPEEKALVDGLFSRGHSFVISRKHAKKGLRSVAGHMKAVLKQAYRKYYAANSRHLWRFLWLSLIMAGAGLAFLQVPVRDQRPIIYTAYGAFVFTMLGLMLLVFHRLLKAPTTEGREVMDRIEGFKKILFANYKTARAFDKRPEMDGPPSLERHLPYAIALGIDSEYVSIRMQHLDWYAAKSQGFSARDLTSSVARAGAGPIKRSRSAKPQGGGIG